MDGVEEVAERVGVGRRGAEVSSKGFDHTEIEIENNKG